MLLNHEIRGTHFLGSSITPNFKVICINSISLNAWLGMEIEENCVTNKLKFKKKKNSSHDITSNIISLHKKIKFSIEDFFSKCDQIRSFLRIWLYLLKNSLIENFIFCAVYIAIRSKMRKHNAIVEQHVRKFSLYFPLQFLYLFILFWYFVFLICFLFI